jgi:UDP-N-acetylmuramoyl-tripeptide--D-alanyl-D-alanine ligase
LLSLPGQHQVINALQAIAAVAALGVDVIDRLPRLAAMVPVAGRMVRHACGKGLLVDDTYNANPGSVLAAGCWLATQARPQMFVLGGVAELGPQEQQLHEQMGRQLAELKLDALVTVGKRAQPAARSFGAGAVAVACHEDALPLARDVLATGGCVLVKGSRSSAMEKVVQGLLNKAHVNEAHAGNPSGKLPDNPQITEERH